MKAKFYLFAGIILIIFSVYTLIQYHHMETKMPGFHAHDIYSWISLCFGVGQLFYFIGRNKKN